MAVDLEVVLATVLHGHGNQCGHLRQPCDGFAQVKSARHMHPPLVHNIVLVVVDLIAGQAHPVCRMLHLAFDELLVFGVTGGHHLFEDVCCPMLHGFDIGFGVGLLGRDRVCRECRQFRRLLIQASEAATQRCSSPKSVLSLGRFLQLLFDLLVDFLNLTVGEACEVPRSIGLCGFGNGANDTVTFDLRNSLLPVAVFGQAAGPHVCSSCTDQGSIRHEACQVDGAAGLDVEGWTTGVDHILNVDGDVSPNRQVQLDHGCAGILLGRIIGVGILARLCHSADVNDDLTNARNNLRGIDSTKGPKHLPHDVQLPHIIGRNLLDVLL
mmetsp:Transcript_88173/g.210602  ORF Transcript_88173/g.210602 Transcript_88173/m.210602 type:complete len:325 (+) Transcript_88173:343-1317(+)